MAAPRSPRPCRSTTTCSPRSASTRCSTSWCAPAVTRDIDVHHTVEDVAIALGQALAQALGDKAGISRFGDALVPLDEALAQAVVDVSGRPYCVHTGEPEGQEYHLIGGHFTGSLTRHVLESLAHHARICLHVRVLAGRDPHHIVEAQFKAVARALRPRWPWTRACRACRPPRAPCDASRTPRRRAGDPAAGRRCRGADPGGCAGPLAAACALAGVEVDAAPTPVGAVACAGDTRARRAGGAAEAISRLLPNTPVLLVVRADGRTGGDPVDRRELRPPRSHRAGPRRARPARARGRRAGRGARRPSARLTAWCSSAGRCRWRRHSRAGALGARTPGSPAAAAGGTAATADVAARRATGPG